MKLSDFDFYLPEGCIAQHPAMPRDSARLLYIASAAENFKDLHIHDLPALARAGDVWVINNSRVIPARLMGKRGAMRVEILLHKRKAKTRWEVFARPLKRLRCGEAIQFADDFEARVSEILPSGLAYIDFEMSSETMMLGIARYGRMPLPPYIKRDNAAQPDNHPDNNPDIENYQTIYAKPEGSVAAPTAGLHFTPDGMAALRAKGVTFVEVTLHVGAGTFQPVKVDDITQHRMHSEYAEITSEAASLINQAKAEKRRIVAVGTTATRVLETVADAHGRVHSWQGETSIFITPGTPLKCVDAMLTNFHLPKSTLFMLVSAFGGVERMKAAYAHAIVSGYRFYSYGDACFIEGHASGCGLPCL